MSRVYANWERLIGAVLEREELRRLAFCESFSTSSSVDFSLTKIVVKMSVNNDKSRSKALKTSVSISGVESVAVLGPERDQLEVVGEEEIDAVELIRRLRKHVGHAELVSVSHVEELVSVSHDEVDKEVDAQELMQVVSMSAPTELVSVGDDKKDKPVRSLSGLIFRRIIDAIVPQFVKSSLS